MSLTSGLRSGLQSGLRSGLNPGGAVDPFAGVTQDATSGKYYPADSTEWGVFLTAASLSGSVATPNSVWLCQEASGNLSDAIGSLTLTANATPLYQQTVADHARKGVGFNQTANQRFGASAGVGPNPNTTSQTWLWFQNMPSSVASTRNLSQISNGATSCSVTLLATNKIRIAIAGNLTDGTSNPIGAGTMPVVTKYNRTGSEIKVFTSQEKITGVYSAAVVDGIKGLANGTSYLGECVYGCMWSGANAEMSDATIKALLEALGWTIPWS